jgi:hypothetical protein
MNVSAATRFAIAELLVVVLTVGMQSRILAESKDFAKDAKPYQGLIVDPDSVATTNVEAW